jgi:hypothetical protein
MLPPNLRFLPSGCTPGITRINTEYALLVSPPETYTGAFQFIWMLNEHTERQLRYEQKCNIRKSKYTQSTNQNNL